MFVWYNKLYKIYNYQGGIMMDELWKDVKGYEGFYQVSNTGKVRSLDKEVFNKLTGRMNFRKGIERKQQFYGGYFNVRLIVDGFGKKFTVHRLVAEAFVDNPNNYNVVNHLDGVKTNNNYTNLEWTTVKGNVIHAWENGLNHFSEEQREKQKEYMSIPIVGTNATTGKKLYFKSAADAARELGMTKGRIRDCCNGNAKQTKGWFFEDDDSTN